MNHARQPRHVKSQCAVHAGRRMLATLAMALGVTAAGSLGTALVVAAPAGATAVGTVPAVAVPVGAVPAGSHPATERPSAFTLSARQLAGTRAHAGGVVLTARAVGANSVGLQVTFSVKVTQFEYAPLLQVGTATTGASGQATVTYQPTWNGPQEFVASAQAHSGAQLGPATASISAGATTGFSGTVEASRPDGAIGRWVVVGLLTLVACVWVTLVAVVVRVYLTMRTGPA